VAPLVPEIGSTGHTLELPVDTDERPKIGLCAGRSALCKHPQVPGAEINPVLGRQDERTIAEGFARSLETSHDRAIGTSTGPIEIGPPDGVGIRPAHCGVVRPPTVIDPGRLIAGRHPCAWGPENAPAEVRELSAAGVTLFLDLTQDGELDPYAYLVSPPSRHLRMSIHDFSVPTPGHLVETLDVIDAELGTGGLVYVHCWAGCGRTGVVVGAWLVRHGTAPNDALTRIAEARGLGCPQTLEQRMMVLGWQAGQ
jgi:protein-tyrosine phosphatase